MTPAPAAPDLPRFRLLLVPERQALPAGTPSTLRMLVRVQAPERGAADAPRGPLAIVLVRLFPVRAGAHLDEQRHGQLGNAAHQ